MLLVVLPGVLLVDLLFVRLLRPCESKQLHPLAAGQITFEAALEVIQAKPLHVSERLCHCESAREGGEGCEGRKRWLVPSVLSRRKDCTGRD